MRMAHVHKRATCAAFPSCCCTLTTRYQWPLTQEPDELFAAQNTTAHEAIIGVAGDTVLGRLGLRLGLGYGLG